ncbi:hypothetical protein KW805_02590 [Candidatus Pacearchaeota archaeon]|nr:hypothetical protein [Candidatus Pacearchaeota archaeon]
MKRSVARALVAVSILIVVFFGLYGTSNRFRVTTNAIFGIGAPVLQNIPLNETNATNNISLLPPLNKTPETPFVTTSGGSGGSSGGGGGGSATTENNNNVQPPQGPSDLTAQANGSRVIILSWQNHDPASSLIVERKSHAGDEFETLSVMEADATSFIDAHVSPKANYIYRITADIGSTNDADATTWILGDLNNDGAVSISDFIDFATIYPRTIQDLDFNTNADLDNDKVIDKKDFIMFKAAFNGIDPLNTTLGDINNDELVSVADFIDFGAAFNSTSIDAHYNLRADLDSDGDVDSDDMALFETIFNYHMELDSLNNESSTD